MDSTKPLANSAVAARRSPSTRRNDRTIRSAAPLSIRHLPITAAKAITIPMSPATCPNAAATRAIFIGTSPGDSRLTRIAAVTSARKALSRNTRIMPMTVTTPKSRITRGSITGWFSGLRCRVRVAWRHFNGSSAPRQAVLEGVGEGSWRGELERGVGEGSWRGELERGTGSEPTNKPQVVPLTSPARCLSPLFANHEM